MKIAKHMLHSLVLLLVFYSCSITGDNNENSNNGDLLQVPENVRVAGDIDRIHIFWDQNDPSYLYNIYRSIDGVEFILLNAEPVDGDSYTDILPDEEELKSLLYYKVRSVIHDQQSEASALVRTMTGERLQEMYTDGLELAASSNPYIIDASVTITEGDLEVKDGAVLVLLDNAELYLRKGRSLIIAGDFQVYASPRHRAAIAALGSLDNNEGITISFSPAGGGAGAAQHDRIVIENTDITGIRSGGTNGILVYRPVTIRNSRLIGNSLRGTCYMNIYSSLIFEQSKSEQIVFSFQSDLTGHSDFSIRNSIILGGYYSLYYTPGAMTIDGGIHQNAIDAQGGIHFGGSSQLDVSGNHWLDAAASGTDPAEVINFYGSPGDVLFEPQLTAMPSNIGVQD